MQADALAHITGLSGVTAAQRAALLALGAVERYVTSRYLGRRRQSPLSGETT